MVNASCSIMLAGLHLLFRVHRCVQSCWSGGMDSQIALMLGHQGRLLPGRRSTKSVIVLAVARQHAIVRRLQSRGCLNQQ